METRTTYDTEWCGEPVTVCSWCHFVQFEGEPPNHVAWCDRDAAEGGGVR